MSAVAASRPLAGRVIVVTRARAQAEGLRARLEEAGATVLAVPTIVIESPADWAPLDRALGALAGFDWVVFTSVNGVEMTAARMAALGVPIQRLLDRRLAAIGPATAAALRAAGAGPEVVVPAECVAESLAARLAPALAPAARVLLPRAAETRDFLVRELEAAGAQVLEVPAYRTRPSAEGAAELRVALDARRVDAVTFTSSSTVRHFTTLFAPEDMRRLLADVAVACIGPITAATAAALGLAPAVVADEYTVPGLTRALERYYSSEDPGTPGPAPRGHKGD